MFPWNRINGSLDMIPKRTTSHHREKEQQIAPQWSPSPRRAEAVVRWDQVEAARKKEFITSLHDQMEEQERRRQAERYEWMKDPAWIEKQEVLHRQQQQHQPQQNQQQQQQQQQQHSASLYHDNAPSHSNMPTSALPQQGTLAVQPPILDATAAMSLPDFDDTRHGQQLLPPPLPHSSQDQQQQQQRGGGDERVLSFEEWQALQQQRQYNEWLQTQQLHHQHQQPQHTYLPPANNIPPPAHHHHHHQQQQQQHQQQRAAAPPAPVLLPPVGLGMIGMVDHRSSMTHSARLRYGRELREQAREASTRARGRRRSVEDVYFRGEVDVRRSSPEQVEAYRRALEQQIAEKRERDAREQQERKELELSFHSPPKEAFRWDAGGGRRRAPVDMMQQGPGEQTQKPKQQLAPIGRNVATDVPLRSDSRNDLHPSRSESKNSMVAVDMYRMELEKQIEEKRERDARLRMQELEEDLRMERHLDMNPYDPWGKAGGGAPNRDADGNIISNLRGHVGISHVDERTHNQRRTSIRPFTPPTMPSASPATPTQVSISAPPPPSPPPHKQPSPPPPRHEPPQTRQTPSPSRTRDHDYSMHARVTESPQPSYAASPPAPPPAPPAPPPAPAAPPVPRDDSSSSGVESELRGLLQIQDNLQSQILEQSRMLSVLEHIAEAGNNGSVVHGPGVDAARVTRGYADDTDYLLRRDATSLAHPPSVTGASVEEAYLELGLLGGGPPVHVTPGIIRSDAHLEKAVSPLPRAGHQRLQQRYRGAAVEDDDAFLEGVEERIQARKARMATTMRELAP